MKKNFNIIEIKNVDTIYEGEKKPVIRDINLTVRNGEFITIIGPNGAGKTTLIETINGLLQINNGKVFVFRKEISKNKSEIRKDIGYVIQNIEIDTLSPFLSKDIVMTGRTGKIGVLRFSSKKDWEIVWKCMGLVGMIDLAYRPIGKLSGGELQKILIARALASQPKLLLLDEPFSNLDFSARKQIEILLNRIHLMEKMTIVMISHDLSFIPSRCHRIIVLDHGKIIMDGDKKKILTSGTINTIFHNNED